MYKIIYGIVEFEVRGTYKTLFNKEKDFLGIKQVYIEPILIKLEDCDMCVNNLHNDIMRDIEDDLEIITIYILMNMRVTVKYIEI